MRFKLELDAELLADQVKEIIMAHEKTEKYLKGKALKNSELYLPHLGFYLRRLLR